MSQLNLTNMAVKRNHTINHRNNCFWTIEGRIRPETLGFRWHTIQKPDILDIFFGGHTLRLKEFRLKSDA